MAQFTTTTDTTDALNDKEDVEDVIYRLDPMDTWYFTNARKKSVKNIYHQWHMD